MGTGSAAGALHGTGQLPSFTDRANQGNILLPAFVVEVQGQEAAGIVRQNRIDTDDVPTKLIPASEMSVNSLIRQWKQLAVFTVRATSLWLEANTRFPLVAADRRIAAFPGLCALPSQSKHILPPTKQGSIQSDFLPGRGIHVDRIRRHPHPLRGLCIMLRQCSGLLHGLVFNQRKVCFSRRRNLHAKPLPQLRVFPLQRLQARKQFFITQITVTHCCSSGWNDAKNRFRRNAQK